MRYRTEFHRPIQLFLSFLLIAFYQLPVDADTVDIAGQVVDTFTNLPIASANVTIKSLPSFNTYTDTLGMFVLKGHSGSTLAEQFSDSRVPFIFGLRESSILLFNDHLVHQLTLDMWNSQGRIISQFRKANVHQGLVEIAINKTDIAAGLFFFRVTRDGDVSVRTCPILQGGIVANNNLPLAMSEPKALHKRFAFIDTLIVSKQAYCSKSFAIQSYSIQSARMLILPQRHQGMVLIHSSGQTFSMASSGYTTGSGYPSDWQGPPHQVSLSHDFWIDTTEVTQGDFKALMHYNPTCDNTPDLSNPANCVSWPVAAVYCNARSNAAGLDSVYTYSGTTSNETDALGSYTVFTDIASHLDRNGFRLPTEAEWEFACRAGTSTGYYWGDISAASTVDQYAWYGHNSGNSNHHVATRLPNPWGLYDMVGNEWEWANDWFAIFTPSSQTDPTGPSVGQYRVIRGSDIDGSNIDMQSTTRNISTPFGRYPTSGFRVARNR